MTKELENLGGESSYGLGGQLYHLLYGRDSIAFAAKGRRSSQRETKNQHQEIRHPDGRIEYIEQTLINEVIYEEWEN